MELEKKFLSHFLLVEGDFNGDQKKNFYINMA